MLTGRRFRVQFTCEQEQLAQQIASTCRVVWNIGLEQRREYRRRGAWINYHEQAGEVADAKAEHPWLAEAPGHCLQQTLMDLDKACRRHGTFRVRWRSSRRWRPSFRFPEGNKMVVEKLNGRHARVKLPKLGWVRFRLSRPLDSALLRSATLTRSAKGTVEAPGSNVKAKSGLNRAILSKGWHLFASALTSASRYSGTRVVVVPAQHTSQPCSACGHVDSKSRESQAVFRCTHCSYTEHADVNAAKNILAAGLAVTACEDSLQPSGRVASLKQEPAGNREGLLLRPHTAA